MSDTYQEVGCKQCGKGGAWRVFTDGNKIVSYQCNHCRHVIDIDNLKLKTEPDYTAYDMRFFT